MSSGDIVDVISFAWDLLVLIVGVVFLAVIIRRFDMMVFHTKRISVTLQELSKDFKKTSESVQEVKSLLTPHYPSDPPAEGGGDENTEGRQ